MQKNYIYVTWLIILFLTAIRCSSPKKYQSTSEISINGLGGNYGLAALTWFYQGESGDHENIIDSCSRDSDVNKSRPRTDTIANGIVGANMIIAGNLNRFPKRSASTKHRKFHNKLLH